MEEEKKSWQGAGVNCLSKNPRQGNFSLLLSHFAVSLGGLHFGGADGGGVGLAEAARRGPAGDGIWVLAARGGVESIGVALAVSAMKGAIFSCLALEAALGGGGSAEAAFWQLQRSRKNGIRKEALESITNVDIEISTIPIFLVGLEL